MLCGLLSDTHNNHQHLETALQRFRNLGVSSLLHAGDVTTAATLHMMEGFHVWIAQGNMDRDPGLRSQARALFGPGSFRDVHKLTFGDTRMALLHSDLHPEWTDLLTSGLYDFIIYGHTHNASDKTVGKTRIINPGSLSGTRFKQPSCAVLDTETDLLIWIHV